MLAFSGKTEQPINHELIEIKKISLSKKVDKIVFGDKTITKGNWIYLKDFVKEDLKRSLFHNKDVQNAINLINYSNKDYSSIHLYELDKSENCIFVFTNLHRIFGNEYFQINEVYRFFSYRILPNTVFDVF